jgi:hypothetical protein
MMEEKIDEVQAWARYSCWCFEVIVIVLLGLWEWISGVARGCEALMGAKVVSWLVG